MTAPAIGFGVGRRVADQVTTRSSGRWVDAHGRQWWSVVERATGAPASPIRPSGWLAPEAPFWARGRLVPDQKYITIETNGAHDRLILINYAEWLSDWDIADAERADLIRQLIAESKVDLATLEKYYTDPPKHVLDAVGPGPAKRWPREFIEAASEGNAWALGLTDKIPSWAHVILDRWERLQDMTQRHVAARAVEATAVKRYPDAEDEEAPLEQLLDIEEAVDPDATGGKPVPVPSRKKPHPRGPRDVLLDD